MTRTNSNAADQIPQSTDLATSLTDSMREVDAYSQVEIDQIEASSEPLEEPVIDSFREPVSIGSVVRWFIICSLEEREDVDSLSYWDTLNDQYFDLSTHPFLLEESNRLVVPPALAKFYQYGLMPNYFAVREGGSLHKYKDFDVDSVWEFREMFFRKWSVYDPSPRDEDLFDDIDAVVEFSQRTTTEEIPWEQYLPWIQSVTVPNYLLDQRAEEKNWSEFPEFPSLSEVPIDNRFEPAPDPTFDDFIRYAILRKIEQEFPSVTSISTGPGAWSTDRVSMVVRPTGFGNPGVGSQAFVPGDVMIKMNRYGYRPIDAWYAYPDIGHEERDPISPRKVVFARGEELRRWIDDVLPGNQVFADASIVSEEWTGADFNWRDLVRSCRTRTLTYRELRQRAKPTDG